MVIRTLHQIGDTLNVASKAVCGIFMGFLGVVCTIQVIFRYFLNNSLSWSEESLRYVFIWMIFIATAATVKEGSAACIDLLRTKIKRQTSKAVYESAFFTLTGITAVILLVFGIQYALMNKNMYSAALHLPMGLVYAAVPTGSFLTVVHCVSGLADAVHELILPAKEGEK